MNSCGENKWNKAYCDSAYRLHAAAAGTAVGMRLFKSGAIFVMGSSLFHRYTWAIPLGCPFHA